MPKTLEAPALPEDPLDIMDGEDEEDDEETKKKRHALLIRLYGMMGATAMRRLRWLNAHLSKGDIDSREWADSFRDELIHAHAEGHMIGRRLAGDTAPMSKADIEAGNEAWHGGEDSQESFFENFLKDIETGRYTDEDGELMLKQVGARSDQYVKSTGKTVHLAFKESLPETEEIDWVLGEAEHCGPDTKFEYNCPALADSGPYTRDTLPTVPRGCKCPCLSSCKCYLTTTAGYSTDGVGTAF